MYNYYNYLEPCALNAEFQFSYPDLIKLPYFAYLTQRGDRGWKEAQRQGEFKENSINYQPFLYLGSNCLRQFTVTHNNYEKSLGGFHHYEKNKNLQK